MDRLWQDIRVSLRGLWKDRAFTLTTVATLALCLAANVAIFAVVDGVLLKPLPFDEPDRLVTISNAYPGAGVAVAATQNQTAGQTRNSSTKQTPRGAKPGRRLLGKLEVSSIGMGVALTASWISGVSWQFFAWVLDGTHASCGVL